MGPRDKNNQTLHFKYPRHYAPINLKPAEGGRQGMGWGFDCYCWPWGGCFD